MEIIHVDSVAKRISKITVCHTSRANKNVKICKNPIQNTITRQTKKCAVKVCIVFVIRVA